MQSLSQKTIKQITDAIKESKAWDTITENSRYSLKADPLVKLYINKERGEAWVVYRFGCGSPHIAVNGLLLPYWKNEIYKGY